MKRGILAVLLVAIAIALSACEAYTDPATNVTSASATLRGHVSCEEYDAPGHWWWEYRKNGGPWQQTAHTPFDCNSSFTNAPVSKNLTGLTPDSHYDFLIAGYSDSDPQTIYHGGHTYFDVTRRPPFDGFDTDPPPDTSISSGGPSGFTNSVSATFGFSSTPSGASFECRLDASSGGIWQSCSSPKSYSGLADGSHTFEVRAKDAAGTVDPSPASRSWTIDTTAPTIQLSGPLKDAADLGEPLTETSYGLTVTSTDGLQSSSGVKSIEILVDGGSNDYAEQACQQGSCPMSLNWTLMTDSYSDAQHSLTVLVKDQLGYTVSESLSLQIDRRGDVYHAKEYTNDPASGGELIAENWVKQGSVITRTEEDGEVKTRNLVPCNTSMPSGAVCDEVRSIETVEDVPSYLQYLSVRVGDPDLPPVAPEFQAASVTQGSLLGQGGFSSVLSSWQIPPPAHGTQYELYNTAGDPTEGESDVKTWVDAATKLPLKQRVESTSGDVLETHYWTYAPDRLEDGQLPADFFSPPAPSSNGDREIAVERADEPLGSQRDVESGQWFDPYYLGPHPVIPSVGEFCLVSSDVVVMTYDPATITPDPDFPGDAAGAPQTWVEARYRQLPASASCTPGTGSAATPDLQVISEASASSDAAGWTALYKDIGEAVEQNPLDEGFAYSGLRPVVVESSATLAYLVALGGDEASALIPLGGSTVMIDGPFNKLEVPVLANLLAKR
jgi:hypothetical protein